MKEHENRQPRIDAPEPVDPRTKWSCAPGRKVKNIRPLILGHFSDHTRPIGAWIPAYNMEMTYVIEPVLNITVLSSLIRNKSCTRIQSQEKPLGRHHSRKENQIRQTRKSSRT